MNGRDIWSPGAEIKAPHIKLVSDNETSLQKATLAKADKIVIGSKYLNGQDTQFEAQKKIKIHAKSLADLHGSDIRTTSAVFKSNHVDLQKAQLAAKTSIKKAQHVNVNEATIHGSFTADSAAVEGFKLNATVDTFKIRADRLECRRHNFMPKPK